MSLRSNLNQIIRNRHGGIFTLKELEDYCHRAHYKLSNAERRLRPSESPHIERVMKNGAIVGYRYTGTYYNLADKAREVMDNATLIDTTDFLIDLTQPEPVQRRLL